MRSWARRILEAATISIALVIFRVFCTLRIFSLISLVPGISERAVLFPVLDRFVQLLLLVLRGVFHVLDALDQARVLAPDVVAHRALGGERLLDVDIVEVAV